MAYLVSLTARAERDFTRLYGEIHAGQSAAARQWYLGFRKAILTLEAQPNRCSLAPEKGKLRQLLYGHGPHIYRAIFRVLEKQKHVEVLHIRHGARRKDKAL